MKTLRQIIFTSAMVIGLAFSASAQKDDQKRPPKQDPPKIVPNPNKPPRGNPPKEEKPKKPGMSFFLVSTQHEYTTA